MKISRTCFEIGKAFSEANQSFYILAFNAIGMASEIIDKTLQAHVMNDDARRVVSAFALPFVLWQEILENFSKHFGIDGHFLLQGFCFVNCEVKAVKDVKNSGA